MSSRVNRVTMLETRQ